MANYLGPQHVGNQAAVYEAKLTDSRYDGESARFTFDNYVNIHKTAHTRLDGLTEHGYQAWMKVPRFDTSLMVSRQTS